jgi:hypothetical protein
MNEIINLVMERAGIPADKSKIAVDTVLGFLKNKLPPQFAGQIENALAGGAATNAASGIADSVKDAMGGMFNRGA